MNTETKGKPIGKILLIFFLVLAFTGIGILLQVFVRQSTDLTAKKDSESEIQKQIENKNKEIAGLEKEKEKLNSKLQEQQKKAAEEEQQSSGGIAGTAGQNNSSIKKNSKEPGLFM